MTYSEKLKDPRWQKKRLEILERDEFTCLNCGSKEKELHVHHVIYIKGLQPWEYNQSLISLCWECHIERHNAQNNLLICTSRMTSRQMESLSSFMGMFFDLTWKDEK